MDLIKNRTPQTDLETDWRGEITETKNQIKVKDGESIIFTFADEGNKSVHPDFGTSIVFNVLVDGDKEPKRFYVKANNFGFLAQIKGLGQLTGQKVKVSRKGSKRSDTRYLIEKIQK